MVGIFKIKEKSEDYLLHKLVSDVSGLNTLVKELYEQQVVKARINRDMVRGIKEEGRKYRHKLDTGKERIADIISHQQVLVADITKAISRIERSLNLLIRMEQASLVIHTQQGHDDLSDMVDVHSMPQDKFTHELEHIKMLSGSIDILRVELAKQKDYIAAFDLDENTLDERYFYESEKLESKLSEEEIVNVSQLKDFCNELKKMLNERLGKTMPFISESDRIAQQMIQELKHVRMSNSILSRSLYSFTDKFISQMVPRNKHKRLILFLVLFLLSRLKKYRPDAFYQQLRTTILCYNLLGHMSVGSSQKYIISGSMLMGNLQMLQFLKEKDDEAHVIRDYYHTANKMFNEELSFVSSLLAEFNGENEPDEAILPWVASGARAMKLVFDFDVEVTQRMFNTQKVFMERDEIVKSLQNSNQDCDEEILYLMQHWEKLIPKQIAVF